MNLSQQMKERGIRRTFSQALCRAGLLVLALAGTGLVAPSLATAAPNPACGSYININVTLKSNMNCPNQNGLIVAASGITINLNGHTISNGDGNNTGIYNPVGNKVTVKNGKITGFEWGITYDGTRHGTISNVRSVHNTQDGIIFRNSRNGLITGVRANHNGDAGFNMSNNDQVTVTRSTADHNSLDGVDDETSLATLNGVTADGNGGDGFSVYQPLRVASAKGVRYYTFKNSTATFNGGDGFRILSNATPYQALLVGNTAEFDGQHHKFDSGWGFYAQPRHVAAASTNDGAEGNHSGNCFDVPCHTNP